MGKPSGRADAVDAHVGSRVKTRRKILGLSQTKLGDALGVSFVQVRHYEVGSDRIGAGRLYQISKILDVSVSYFYEDMPAELGRLTPLGMPLLRDEGDLDTMHKRETLDLVRAFCLIENADVRDRLRETVREIAGERQRRRGPNVPS